MQEGSICILHFCFMFIFYMLCAFPSFQRIARSGQAQSVSVPVQTNASLTMPFYSNPMMFSQTSTRSLQDANQRHTDGEFNQDGQLR